MKRKITAKQLCDIAYAANAKHIKSHNNPESCGVCRNLTWKESNKCRRNSISVVAKMLNEFFNK